MMRKNNKNLQLLCFLFFSTVFFSQKNVSLALSGGGAKGFAHIGVIKAIEEYGLHVDKVSGASMGALVGALYATGYSIEEIEDILRAFSGEDAVFGGLSRRDITITNKFNTLTPMIELGVEDYELKLPESLITDARINFLLMYHFSEISLKHSHNFKAFHRELTVASSDILNQKVEYFQSGNLSKILRGTIAFPVALSPFKYNGSLFADGGIYDNLPTKHFPDSDFVIAVNVGTKADTEASQIADVSDISLHLINILSSKSDSTHVQNWDVFIEPELGNVTSTSWNQIDEIIEKGYRETIKVFKQKGIQRQNRTILPVQMGYGSFEKRKISQVNISGLYRLSEAHIKSFLDIEEGSYFSWEDVKNGINRLYVNKLIKYFWVDFKLNDDGSLILDIELKEEILTRFGVGGYYSDILGNNVFAKIDFIGRLGKGETIGFVGTVGNTRNGFKIQAGVPNFIGLNLYEQFSTEFAHNRYIDLDKQDISQSYRETVLNIGLLLNRNMMIHGSVGFKSTTVNSDDDVKDKYKGFHVKASYDLDNLNDLFFPTSGHRMALSYGFNYLTDDQGKFKDINYNTFNYKYMNFGNFFSEKIIFSQEYQLNIVASTNNFKVPVYERKRIDLTRASLGYYDESLYGLHQAFLRYTLKLNITDKLYTYSSVSMKRQWDSYEKINLSSLSLKNIKKGYELGFYYPTAIGPVLLTYSTDEIVPNVYRFSVGYIF